MTAYSQRKGITTQAFRFLLDGKRVNPVDTPGALGLLDGDVVDVVLEQTGGC